MPAAAVIPAPIAYIKVVAVKKLVVGFWLRFSGPPHSGTAGSFLLLVDLGCSSLNARVRRDFYCEKIRVFKAGVLLEYYSME